MPVHTFTHFNGQLFAENRAGTRKVYVPDPLGSTLALATTGGTPTNRYVYWPYGELRQQGGVLATS